MADEHGRSAPDDLTPRFQAVHVELRKELKRAASEREEEAGAVDSGDDFPAAPDIDLAGEPLPKRLKVNGLGGMDGGDDEDTLTPVAACTGLGRALRPVAGSDVSATDDADLMIRCLTYNILAGNLGKVRHFPYCPAEIMEWEGRRQRIVDQVLCLSPDVGALQECNDYWTFFGPTLRNAGYESVYAKRPSRHPSSRSGIFKKDGCCLFFRADRFALVEVEEVSMLDCHDRVGLIALLRDAKTGREVVVATVHIWWNSSKPAVQVREMCFMRERIQGFTQEHVVGEGGDTAAVPVVFMGDFNSTPDTEVYRFVSTGQPPDWDALGGREEPVAANQNEFGSFVQGSLDVAYAPLTSAYAGYSPDHADAPVTTATHSRCRTIDYIFYNPAALVATRVLEIPTVESLQAHDGPSGWQKSFNEHAVPHAPDRQIPLDASPGIPNREHPSDHIPLLAVLRLL